MACIVCKKSFQVTPPFQVAPPDGKSAKELTLRFRNKIKTIFEKWWEDQANVTGQNKLDFYYKYKRTFKYEEYLKTMFTKP